MTDRVDRHGSAEPGGTVIVPPGPARVIVAALCREKSRLERHNAELGRLHLQLAELVQRFLPLSDQARQGAELRLLPDRQSVASYLDTAIALVRHEVLFMHTESVLAAIDGRQLRDRGVGLRAICPRGPAEDRAVGFDIRVTDTLPVGMIIFDAGRSVLAVDPADPAAGVIAIESELVVRCLVSVFEHCWPRAAARRPARLTAGDAPALSAQERTVLRMLAAGLKDEKIARRLGVSLRTISRVVGELMRRLDADSRFQAGVHAAELGWMAGEGGRDASPRS